jgi:hypothetical protein
VIRTPGRRSAVGAGRKAVENKMTDHAHAVYEKMLAERKARKVASSQRSKARTAERKASAKEYRERMAAQHGPHICFCCKSQFVAAADVICDTCHADHKAQDKAWREEKPRIIGTF